MLKMKTNYILGLLTLLVMTPVLALDPTKPDIIQPTTKEKVAVQTLVLTMVRMSDNKPSATINGQLYHVGDKIGGYSISRITAKQVILKNNRGQLRLDLLTKGALRKSS